MTVSRELAPRADAPLRLFIALWPSAAATRRLATLTDELHAACGGRKIPRANQHVTLAFLGNLAPKRVTEVERVLQRVAGSSFELRLDVLEYHKRGGLWWARATQVDPALERLVQDLREVLNACGLRVEHRRFVPHITLVRDARHGAHGHTALPVTWRVRELTLVRSQLDRYGARYEVLHRVALANAAASAQRQRDARA